jgi:hypothetical protein
LALHATVIFQMIISSHLLHRLLFHVVTTTMNPKDARRCEDLLHLSMSLLVCEHLTEGAGISGREMHAIDGLMVRFERGSEDAVVTTAASEAPNAPNALVDHSLRR